MYDTFFLITSIVISIAISVIFVLVRLKKHGERKRKIFEAALLHFILYIVCSSIWFLGIAIDGFSQIFGLVFYLLIYLLAFIIILLISQKK